MANPTWSPDGAWIAFVRSVGMQVTFDLIAIEVASGDETVLANGATTVSGWRDQP